jgi:hypothetical protein
VAAALAIGVCAAPASAVTFTDVTTDAGINHLQHVGNAPGAGLFRTGGAAAADYDNDGWVDLFVTRLNARPLLYRNLGDGTFQDMAVSAGFLSSLPANGAAWGDIENDGDQDLYVTSSGGTRYYLYVNDGSGKFTEQAGQRGASIDGVFRYGQSATFGDYDGDGFLDLHTNDWATEASVSTSRLLRNLGAANPGHFEDVTAAAGLNVFRPSHFADGSTDDNVYRYSSTFTDLDRDGRPDLAIAADFLTSQVFWNNGDGTFSDGTMAAGVGTDEDGMGSAIGDYDGDGRLDWFVSALVDVPGGFPPHSGNRLFRNRGDRTFSDETDAAGVRSSGWSWGTSYLDYDNDRDLDLFVTNGWDTTTSDPSRVYRNDGGIFTDVSTAVGVTDAGMGRGLVTLDFDNDGDQDVFVVNHGAKAILYRNDGGNENAWLKLKLEGTESNRDGLGAFITLDPDDGIAGDELVREIGVGSNFLGHNDVTAHFGLGSSLASIDRITIEWPSGLEQQLTGVVTNQLLHVVEGGAAGDFNGDGAVDGTDFLAWQRGLSPTPLSAQDLAKWKANFGATSGAAATRPAPEPTTIVQLIAVSSFLPRRRSSPAAAQT